MISPVMLTKEKYYRIFTAIQTILKYSTNVVVQFRVRKPIAVVYTEHE